MAKILLNDRKLAGLKPEQGKKLSTYFDTAKPGFGVRVSATGRKSFFVLQRVKGKLVWIGLRDPKNGADRYPALKLARARELAEEALRATTVGRNPVAERALEESRTFKALAADYLELHAKPNKVSWQDDERALRGPLAPLADIPVTEITRADVQRILDGITKRGKLTYAERVLACVRKVLNFGIDREWLDANPCARIKAGETKRRQRVLTDDEVRRILQYLDAPPETAMVKTPAGRVDRATLWPLLSAWMKLRLLTGQRSEGQGGIVEMRWADLMLDGKEPVWTIPVTKNEMPQVVPLTRTMVKILKQLRDRSDDPVYVFAGIRSPRDRQNVLAPLNMSDLQNRDLRRTCATNLAKFGVSRFIVKRVLNHKDAEVTAIYDVYRYLPEVRAALDKWDARLAGLANPKRKAA